MSSEEVDDIALNEAEDERALAPRIPRRLEEKHAGKRVIVVLLNASLETVKTKTGYALLNCDDHKNIHKKYGRDPGESRPDILHQALLSLLDSPLNKAGLLQVYIESRKKVLIEVNPHIRIPRTYKRFAGLMVQLLHKLKIRASNGSETLLKVIKNPVTRHLPPKCRKIGTSVTGNLIDPLDLVKALPQTEPLVFTYGAHAHGPADADWVEESVALSSYPLSASKAIERLLCAFEHHWGIL